MIDDPFARRLPTKAEQRRAAKIVEEIVEEERIRAIAAPVIYEMAFPPPKLRVLCSCRWRKDRTGLESAR